MANYQPSQVRFLNHGQNWNRAVDTIAADQWCYLRNVRSYVDGTMNPRPGLTTFVTLGGPGDYYTVISRLNNDNLPLFGNAWSFSYILGLTRNLYVGTDAAHLTNATVNPVATPLTPTGSGQLNPFSGNPLSVVDMSPVGTDLSFKYIGDSQQNCSVGYYPGDTPNGATPTMARCISMGMLPPPNFTVPTAAGAGLLNGAYQWRFVYRRPATGTQSNPSAATRVTVATPALTLTNQQAFFTVPTTPIDPQTNAADTHVVVDVYRFGGTVFRWKLIAAGLASGVGFTDNVPDSAILNALEPSQATNPISGISHFNLFQPFVIADVGHFGTATLSQNSAGKWVLVWVSGDLFQPGWLPGSTIALGNKLFTIFQITDDLHLELTEDATVPGAGTYAFAVPTGTLRAGNPLKHLWGPWGLGQTGGSYIFGCGNPLAPGVLFWTNGNDPDSTDTYNSLNVTEPSEPLQNGCVYAGNTYVWSTERMFQITASLTVPGQFVVQELPGGRGIWMEYSLEVQTTSFADISVTWRGKDGIYDFSAGGGLRSISNDQMYPLYPHDNQPGIPLAKLFPFLPNNIEPVPVPDDVTNIKFQKLTWFDGYLFYDYLGLIGTSTDACTQVWDSRVNAWISTDIYNFNLPICRGTEIAANNLKIGIGNVLYDYVGVDDVGNAIVCRIISRADDFGDGRQQKQLGDLMLDVNPASSTVSPRLLTNYHNTSTPLTTSSAAVRTQIIEDFASGGGILSITAGLDLSFNSSPSGLVTFYQYQLSYLVKPDTSVGRATDWTDDGYVGAKFLQGFVIQANTFGATVNLTLQTDCSTNAQTFPINTGNCEQEVPFSLQTPVIAHMMRLTSSAPISMGPPFNIKWVWEPAPELTQYWITQGTSFGIEDYFHHRDALVAIQSAVAVTLTIIPDSSAGISYTLPSTGSILLKPWTSLAPMKCRIAQYSVTSAAPGFRLYQKDTVIRIKGWRDQGPWQVVRPFGDLSFQNGARI